MTHKIEVRDSISMSRSDTSDHRLAYQDSPVVEERERMILNPNREVVDKIISRIFKCNGKCPCQPQDDSTDTRCPCSEFTSKGICHCNLFVPESKS